MSDFSGKGWLAEIVLRYEVKREITRLTEKRHIGPLMVQRPFYPGARYCTHICFTPWWWLVAITY